CVCGCVGFCSPFFRKFALFQKRGVKIGKVRNHQTKTALKRCLRAGNWLRGRDLNPRPSGYEPDELPGCSTPRALCLSTLGVALGPGKPFYSFSRNGRYQMSKPRRSRNPSGPRTAKRSSTRAIFVNECARKLRPEVRT